MNFKKMGAENIQKQGDKFMYKSSLSTTKRKRIIIKFCLVTCVIQCWLVMMMSKKRGEDEKGKSLGGTLSS